MALPTGTVTFLFTDIEGSTRLLQELGEAYGQVQTDHMRLMREAIAVGGGQELRTEGDAFFAVFTSASGAVRAAVTAQRAFAAHDWSHGRPLRVRMGMHTGEGRLGGDDYLGIDVNRAARIAAAGHGGQVLLSDTTRSVAEKDLPEGVTLRDLGGHRLKDLAHPEHLYDLVVEGLPAEFPALKTLEAPIYLPAQLTSFVGRERELESLTSLLDGTRLVTLTGPGGTGKTRLAVEAAGRLADAFPDGTYFVDLSPITDPRLVPDTIASALRLQPDGSRPALDVVIDHVRDLVVLLVVDNFEHVLPGANAVSTVLRTAPRVRGLITSRAPLGITGEHEVAVPPLAVPAATDDPSALRQAEAVTLFAHRATAVDATFTLTDGTIPTVAEICARLDGLPLAIELAASRIRVLPPRTILKQLDHRLAVLVGGPRDSPARQRTLRTAIAWSYDLLEEDIAAFFRRACVFAGGWTLRSADVVANRRGELGETVDLLDALLQHSLVERRMRDTEPRFRMLETIREFGLERLEGSGEEETIRELHARHFLDLAEEADSHVRGPDQERWLTALTDEHGNVRAALGWATREGRADVALRLVAASWRFWQFRGHLIEGRDWAEAVVAMPGSETRDAIRARALAALGGIAYWQGEFERAIRAYEDVLAIYRELGDRPAIAQALSDLAYTRGVAGDAERAIAPADESLAIRRELGDRRGEAWGLATRAAAAWFTADLGGARAYFEQALEVFDEVEDDRWGKGNALIGLGTVATLVGDLDEARTRTLQALEVIEGARSAPLIAHILEVLAAVARLTGRLERAVRLAGAADALKDVGGARVQAPPAFVPFPDPRIAARETLDEDLVRRAWADGKRMDLDQAVAYAREDR